MHRLRDPVLSIMLVIVIGVVAGTVGSFAGMSIAAGLCTRVIVTPQARIGLNGPAVIEQEGGVDEFDSSDHALIWAVAAWAAWMTAALVDGTSTWVALALTASAGAAVLGARRPGVVPWNFVVAALLFPERF